MNRAGRAALDVGIGMAAVVAVAWGRRLAAVRRLDEGQPASTRLMRRLEKERARSAALWAESHLQLLRELLTASEKATVQLTAWDNARRTSEAMLDSAEVVEGSMATDAAGSGSTRQLLRTKVSELHGDAEPYLQIARMAEAELDVLQQKLRKLLAELRRGAPPDVSGPAQRLVAAHESARRPNPGKLDELRARRRLDELATLRESLENTLARLMVAGG